MTDKTRFEQEIRIQQQMRNENIVQLIDLYQDTLNYYIIIEFCPNGELFGRIVSNKKLSEDEARIFFSQILNGLVYIHSVNVAHRDLKPENILIDENGRAKISDFGLSKFIGQDGVVKTSCGSPVYVSPEVISGKPYDPKKSDMWSAGVILYAMVTGQLPWTKRNKIQLYEQIKKAQFPIPKELSEDCVDLIKSLMNLDINNRLTAKQALQHKFMTKKAVSALPKLVPEGTKLVREGPRPVISLRKLDTFFEKEMHEIRYKDRPMSTSSDNCMDPEKKEKFTFSKVVKRITLNHKYKEVETKKCNLVPLSTAPFPTLDEKIDFEENVTKWKKVVKMARIKNRPSSIKSKK